jgi:hypothetical protein
MSLRMMIWALERAIRYNLFCAEKAQKRISTSIPSAKTTKTNLTGFKNLIGLKLAQVSADYNN